MKSEQITSSHLRCHLDHLALLLHFFSSVGAYHFLHDDDYDCQSIFHLHDGDDCDYDHHHLPNLHHHYDYDDVHGHAMNDLALFDSYDRDGHDYDHVNMNDLNGRDVCAFQNEFLHESLHLELFSLESISLLHLHFLMFLSFKFDLPHSNSAILQW